MKFLTRYNPPVSPGIDFSDSPSMTQQHFKDDCDINEMIKKYQTTGVLPQRTDALYGDFSGFPDNPLDAKRVFDEAQDRFMQLPADFRKQLNNDPARFLDFIMDPANRDVCVQHGIFNPPKEITPVLADGDKPVASPVLSENTNVFENKS